MDSGEYVGRWAHLHGGYDGRSNPLVHRWLAAVYVLARPLADRGVSPHAVSLVGVVSAAASAALTPLGFRWALPAAVLVAVAGLLDGLDGAVATLRARSSEFGAVVDAVADRVGDVLFVTALWLAGAPAWSCVGGGALMFLHEYVRAAVRVAGLREVVAITVWERPTRVLVTVAFLLAHGLFGGTVWPSIGAVAWVLLGLVGLGQLVPVVRRLR